MDTQWSVGLAQTYSLVLIIQLSMTGSMPLFYILPLTPVYHYTKFYEGTVGYMPLGVSCTRLVAVISFANTALPYVLNTYPAL